MKKQNLLKSLILVMAVLTGTVKAFGFTQAEQTAMLSVQSSVAITKSASSVETGSISPVDGSISNDIQASFILKTNDGTESSYKFLVASKIQTIEGEVSAFSEDGSLVFANLGALPSISAVNDAKAHGNNNPNVIVYPITMNITSPMTIEFGTKSAPENYTISINGASEGTLNQILSRNPVQSTFSTGQDQAGSYQAIVYFTAIAQ
ncbi:hypothetical protein IJD34_01905 [bacterium]|nr:hypothetical protein [bacterium]